MTWPLPTLPRAGSARHNRVGMLGPMAERWTPPEPVPLDALPDVLRVGTFARAHRIRCMVSLVQWMAVESSPRWRPESGRTYCDHYAEDLIDQLCGGPTTSAWLAWVPPNGPGSPVVYAKTVREHGATSAFRWLRQHHEAAGWRAFPDAEALRSHLDATGTVGVVYCLTAGSGASHVSVALPDTCMRLIGPPKDGTGLLQSEAGGRNRMWTRRTWYAGRWADRLFLAREVPHG